MGQEELLQQPAARCAESEALRWPRMRPPPPPSTGPHLTLPTLLNPSTVSRATSRRAKAVVWRDMDALSKQTDRSQRKRIERSITRGTGRIDRTAGVERWRAKKRMRWVGGDPRQDQLPTSGDGGGLSLACRSTKSATAHKSKFTFGSTPSTSSSRTLASSGASG
jgi:hypothetical protein